MEISIDLDAAEPVFEQLVHQVKQAVQARHLNPGDGLPSIRQLAGDLQLNNKTVAKAYRLLERDSVIVTKGYRGTFVHEHALENSQTDLKANVREQLAMTIDNLRRAGAGCRSSWPVVP